MKPIVGADGAARRQAAIGADCRGMRENRDPAFDPFLCKRIIDRPRGRRIEMVHDL